jgi:hypothetical protein
MDKTVQNYMKKNSKLFQVRKKLEVGHNSCDVKGQHVISFPLFSFKVILHQFWVKNFFS